MVARKWLFAGLVILCGLGVTVAAPPAVHPVTGAPLVMTCFKGTPVALDGDLGDWPLDAMTPAVLDVAGQINTGQASWSGPADLSAKFYLMWDDKNIYIGVIVKDDKLSMTKSNGDIWNADCIEVFFGTTNTAPTGTHTEHYQYGFNANNQKWNWCNMDSGGQTLPAYMQVGSRITPDGYVCEAAIEYGQIKALKFTPGNTISFHPVLDDTEATDREIQMTWTSREAHDQSLGFGHVILSADSAVPKELARRPNPADKATDVPADVVVSWEPSTEAASHDVYFGTVFADVNTATRTSAKGVLASQGQAGTTFDPPGRLAYGQTYYWRIDEVGKAPDNKIYKGLVWSFTAEPYGYPIQPVAAKASSAQPGMGPEKTINGSGLDKMDQHGTDGTTMWLSTGVAPNWIQYEFDKVYKLADLKVWNYNALIESFMGFGAKQVKIETSTDGTTWTALANVPEFARASGLPDYAANSTVNFGGVEAKFVKLTIEKNWGMAPPTGLSEVRFSAVPVQAFAPQPAKAATGVGVDAGLNWRAGRLASSHKVFFGTDQAAVAGGTAPAKTMTEHSYNPGNLDLGTTYYWKVDEVNAAVTYPGEVWSFSTQDYKVVDDFESYTDKAGAEVYAAWVDGFDNPAKNGAVVGLGTAANGTFGDTTTFHGGSQSMPLAYDNTKAPLSEATRTFAPAQDWTTSGIKTLVLFFYGDPANTSTQLYVKINDTKLVYAGGAGSLQRRRWNQWNVDLSGVPAATLRSVKSLAIGITGGAGKLLIDDVRLYRVAPEIPVAVDPGKTGLVGYYAMSNNVQDGSGSGNNGTVVGAPTYTAGLPAFGTALKLNGTSDCVDLGKKPVFNFAGSFSLSVWANIGTWTNNWGHVMVGNRGEDNIGWQLRRRDSNKICFTTRTIGTDDLGSTMNAPLGEWVHIAGVYDNAGNTKRIYVNGVQDAFAATTPGKVPATTHNTYIGARANSGNTGREGFFSGMLDEVRIYSRALSVAEVDFLSNPVP